MITLSELPPPPPGRSGWPWTEAAPPLPPTQPDSSPWVRISLVTPSYNQAPFLEETIRSILLQGYPNLEYVVMDGGSTDGSVEIIRKYAAWINAWVSEPDQGQAEAINKGLARCTGVLFNWINSDDVLTPGSLAKVAQAWLPDQPVVIYGLARHIDEHGNDLGYCPAQSGHMTLEKLLWVGKYYAIQPATFLPREQVQRAGGLSRSYHYAVDTELWARLQLPMLHVPAVLALYRLHRTSKTVSASVRFINEVESLLLESAERGLLSRAQAQSRARLFAARTYLMPGVRKWEAALISAWAALRAEPTVLPEALLVILKSLVRLLVGEALWAKGRSFYVARR